MLEPSNHYGSIFGLELKGGNEKLKQTKYFEVIECSGSPYEIGQQIGAACRENIQKALEISVGGIAYVNAANKESVIMNAMKYFSLAENFDPDLIDMLRGQASGAGISFEEAFALKCGFDLGAYYNNLFGLCTSFAVTGPATKNRKTLLGQNIDWFPGCPMNLVKIVHPDGLEQLSLVLWGIVEYTLNSTGFGMCANGTWAVTDNYKLKMPIGCYLPKAMRQQTLQAALGILRTNANGLGYYHLASAEEMVGIESIQDDFEIILPQNGILTHSNHYLTDRFKKHDTFDILTPDSPYRIERITKLINDQYGMITPEIMMEILADHDHYPYSICRHVDETKPPEFASETLGAFIMIPEEHAMLIAYGNPCHYEFIEYKL